MSPSEGRQVSGISRLFLSCDLIGSTAYKQRRSHHPQAPWQKVFLQFYWEFPQQLRLLQSDKAHRDARNLQFTLWKAVGDELLFTCDVRCETDVYAAVRLWVATMQEYASKSLSDKLIAAGDGARLGVKGGAFIATFPGPDSESSIPRRPDIDRTGRDVVDLNNDALSGTRNPDDYLYDYFGPSIDTGFRLFHESKSRYFTLSVEVAYVLATLHVARGRRRRASDDLVLRLGAELKGVWGGRTYPVFALDLESEDHIHRAFAVFEPPRDGVARVLDLCRACYHSANWPFHVYLPEARRNSPFLVPPIDPLAGYVGQSEVDPIHDDPPRPESLDEEASPLQ